MCTGLFDNRVLASNPRKSSVIWAKTDADERDAAKAHQGARSAQPAVVDRRAKTKRCCSPTSRAPLRDFKALVAMGLNRPVTVCRQPARARPRGAFRSAFRRRAGRTAGLREFTQTSRSHLEGAGAARLT